MPVFWFAVSFVVLYFVIRTAVKDGILDAEGARRQREREWRFDERLGQSQVDLDAPES